MCYYYMGKIHTSASFYRRGISDKYPRVGANILGNYCVVQNTNLFKQNIPVPKSYSFNSVFYYNRRSIIAFP